MNSINIIHIPKQIAQALLTLTLDTYLKITIVVDMLISITIIVLLVLHNFIIQHIIIIKISQSDCNAWISSLNDDKFHTCYVDNKFSEDAIGYTSSINVYGYIAALAAGIVLCVLCILVLLAVYSTTKTFYEPPTVEYKNPLYTKDQHAVIFD